MNVYWGSFFYFFYFFFTFFMSACVTFLMPPCCFGHYWLKLMTWTRREEAGSRRCFRSSWVLPSNRRNVNHHVGGSSLSFVCWQMHSPTCDGDTKPKFFQKSVAACCAASFVAQQSWYQRERALSGEGAGCDCIMLWKWNEGEDWIGLEEAALINGSAVSFPFTLVSLSTVCISHCRPFPWAHFHFCLCRFQLALGKWVIYMPLSVPPLRLVFQSTLAEYSGDGHVKASAIKCTAVCQIHPSTIQTPPLTEPFSYIRLAN